MDGTSLTGPCLWGQPERPVAALGWSLSQAALQTKEQTKIDGPSNTAAPTPTPYFWERTNIQYLLLAFFAGVLLTLLLLALIFLVMKSCRKCHSSPWALDSPLDPHSGQEPPAKLPSPEEALTYASMTFKISDEKSDPLTKKHSAGLDSVVYSQIKVTTSPDLSSEA